MYEVVLKKSSFNKLFWVFQWFWLIVLFPKSIQLVLYLGIILLVVLNNKKIKLNRTSVFLLVFATIHLLSIIINIIRYNFETERIFAAFNTCALWYLGAIYYSIYSSTKLNKSNFIMIYKSLYRNCWILIVICLATKILSINSINLGFDKITFWSSDWLFDEYSLRFSGGLGYSTLVSEFTLIFFPFSMLYLLVYRKRNYLLICIFTVLMAYTCYSCHSRIGIVLFAVELIITLYILISSTKMAKHAKKIIIFLIIALFLLAIIFYGNEIYSYVVNLINGREGSTSTRLWIYTTSITKTWTESPLIGIGVKIQPGSYPLGSHSTYIGVFYKTGIIGSFVFIVAFISFIKEQWDNSKYIKYGKLMFLAFLLYLVMLSLEDLDGYAWLIISYFAIMGVYNSYCECEIK